MDAESFSLEHEQLCLILRRCAVSGGQALQPEEQELLSGLQRGFRENLERKRRAAGIIGNAWADRRRAGGLQIAEEAEEEEEDGAAAMEA